jgi:hypothetical protein
VPGTTGTYKPLKGNKLQDKDKKKAPSGEKDTVNLNPKLDMEEDTDLEEALSLQQRIKKGIVMRRYAPKLAVARRRAMRRRAQRKVLTRRSRKQAIKDIKTKFSGGRDVTKLSAAEKNRLEKIVKKRGMIVNRLARKLYIGKKQSERKRLNNEFETVNLAGIIDVMEDALNTIENEQDINEQFKALTEVGAGTLKSYLDKSSKDVSARNKDRLKDDPSTPEYAKKVGKLTNRMFHRDVAKGKLFVKDYKKNNKAEKKIGEDFEAMFDQEIEPVEEMTKTSFKNFIKKTSAENRLSKRRGDKTGRIQAQVKQPPKTNEETEPLVELSARNIKIVDKYRRNAQKSVEKFDKDDETLKTSKKDTAGVIKKEETEPLNELSKKTLSSYVKKAAPSLAGAAITRGAIGYAEKGTGKGKVAADTDRDINKRRSGIQKAAEKLAKEENVGGVTADDFIQKEDTALEEAYVMYEQYIERSEKADIVDKLVLTICEHFSIAPNVLKDFIALKKDK